MPTPLEPSDVVLAITTVATADDAEHLVRALLSARLIACGTLMPGARSLYHWEGEVTDESEVVVLLKTVAEQLDAIGEAFTLHHPYDVPELLVFPTHAGLEGYLQWVRTETSVGFDEDDAA
jgi:periplasmic divalent cation tolerance protein